MSQLSNSDYAALVQELMCERDQLASRLEEQRDALEATTAYVELFTKDGVRKQPLPGLSTWLVIPMPR
ncbi:hypothetical protein ACHFCA_26490 [Delftia tsuruhatensis]